MGTVVRARRSRFVAVLAVAIGLLAGCSFAPADPHAAGDQAAADTFGTTDSAQRSSDSATVADSAAWSDSGGSLDGFVDADISFDAAPDPDAADAADAAESGHLRNSDAEHSDTSDVVPGGMDADAGPSDIIVKDAGVQDVSAADVVPADVAPKPVDATQDATDATLGIPTPACLKPGSKLYMQQTDLHETVRLTSRTAGGVIACGHNHTVGPHPKNGWDFLSATAHVQARSASGKVLWTYKPAGASFAHDAVDFDDGKKVATLLSDYWDKIPDSEQLHQAKDRRLHILSAEGKALSTTKLPPVDGISPRRHYVRRLGAKTVAVATETCGAPANGGSPPGGICDWNKTTVFAVTESGKIAWQVHPFVIDAPTVYPLTSVGSLGKASAIVLARSRTSPNYKDDWAVQPKLVMLDATGKIVWKAAPLPFTASMTAGVDPATGNHKHPASVKWYPFAEKSWAPLAWVALEAHGTDKLRGVVTMRHRFADSWPSSHGMRHDFYVFEATAQGLTHPAVKMRASLWGDRAGFELGFQVLGSTEQHRSAFEVVRFGGDAALAVFGGGAYLVHRKRGDVRQVLSPPFPTLYIPQFYGSNAPTYGHVYAMAAGESDNRAYLAVEPHRMLKWYHHSFLKNRSWIARINAWGHTDCAQAGVCDAISLADCPTPTTCNEVGCHPVSGCTAQPAGASTQTKAPWPCGEHFADTGCHKGKCTPLKQIPTKP